MYCYNNHLDIIFLNSGVIKYKSNACTVKIGKGSGPWQWIPGSTTINRGPLPKFRFFLVKIQLVDPNLWQWTPINGSGPRGPLPGSTTFSNYDGPGIRSLQLFLIVIYVKKSNMTFICAYKNTVFHDFSQSCILLHIQLCLRNMYMYHV